MRPAKPTRFFICSKPLGLPGDPPDLGGYVELALTSGFPDPALPICALWG